MSSGWNGSGGATSPQAPAQKGGRQSSFLKGLIGGIVCVLGAVAVYFFVSGGKGDDRPVSRKADAPIREAVAGKPSKGAASADKKTFPSRQASVAKDAAAVVEPEPCDAAAEPSPKKHEPRRGDSLAEQVFKRSSDVEIAWLLMMEPGTSLLGTYHYGETFEKDFLDAAKEPIEIAADDTDEVKELKQAVIEARAELMQKHKAGEKVSQVMSQTREELQQLGLYRLELKQQVEKIAAENKTMSEADANDLVGAANKMLEEHGAKPVEMPVFLKYRIQQMKDGETEEDDE